MTENVVVGCEEWREALIAYLYEEVDTRERVRVAAHVAACAACARELEALGATRQHLAAWAPPDIALGFQIVRPMTLAEAPPPATVFRPARWWSQPLPAWGQAAAAVVIFGAGLAIGTSREPDAPRPVPANVVGAPVSAAMTAAAPPAATADVAELAREVARLRADLAALASSPAATAVSGQGPAVSEAAVLARVRAMIADSEAGLRTDMTLQTTQMARDIELQRRQDLDRFDKRVLEVNTQAGQAFRQTQQDLQGIAKAVGLSLATGR